MSDSDLIRGAHRGNAPSTVRVHVILVKDTDCAATTGSEAHKKNVVSGPHDLQQREAIVLQQVPLFSNYHQDQLTSITQNILIHHKMPVNYASATNRTKKAETNYNHTIIGT